MAHGYADYGDRSPKKIVHAIYDIGELASRLRGIRTFDRLGSILEYDDFGNGLGKSLISTYGAGATYKITTKKFLSSGFSLLMTGGSNGARTTYTTLEYAYPLVTNIGYEAWYLYYYAVAEFEFEIILGDNINIYSFALKFDTVTNILYIYDNISGWVVLDNDFYFDRSSPKWEFLKFVIDAETKKYIRVVTSKQIYDVSAYTADTTAIALGYFIDGRFYIVSDIGANGEAYLDSHLLTIDEP